MDRFDGIYIDSYAGRIGGTFDVDRTDGETLRAGNEVILMVVAKVGAATMKENSVGDMKRVQTFNVGEVTFVDPNAAGVSEMLTTLGVPHQLALIPSVKVVEVDEDDDWAPEPEPERLSEPVAEDEPYLQPGETPMRGVVTTRNLDEVAEKPVEKKAPVDGVQGRVNQTTDPMLQKFLADVQ